MRTLYKVLGGVAALLLMAGGLLALAGWAMGGETNLDFGFSLRDRTFFARPGAGDSVSADVRGEDGDQNLAPFSRVEVDVDLGDVTFETADTYGVALSWREGAVDYRLHYTNEDGKLKVWSTQRHGVNMNGSRVEGSVVIYLPADVELNDVTVESGLGDVSLYTLRSETLTVDAGLGDVSLVSIRTGTLTVDADLGAASLDEVSADRADLTLDLGSLTLSDCRFGQADLDLSLGDLNAAGLTVTDSLTVNAEAGSVDLEGSLGGRTEIYDDLGSVTLDTTLPERDYGYDLRVDLGSVHVNGENRHKSASRSGGTHFLQVEADLGDITVSFA